MSSSILIVLLSAATILLLFVIILYNSLISKRNQVDNAFSSIDVMLRKRYDLIPNLVSTVKGYMEHERSVLAQITELRAQVISYRYFDNNRIDLDNKIASALDKIMLVAENYPDLKASENFLKLQAALNDVEEQISAARRAYNAAVTDYNNAVQMFPTNILASIMGFESQKLFEASFEERKNRNWY